MLPSFYVLILHFGWAHPLVSYWERVHESSIFGGIVYVWKQLYSPLTCDWYFAKFRFLSQNFFSPKNFKACLYCPLAPMIAVGKFSTTLIISLLIHFPFLEAFRISYIPTVIWTFLMLYIPLGFCFHLFWWVLGRALSISCPSWRLMSFSFEKFYCITYLKIFYLVCSLLLEFLLVECSTSLILQC